ncbi:hypothetical protein Syun_028751 [Stephania yunnanensis]|uniref:Uncharacterized protein n=1 Tax=Stephania yunnanensis TaxID=152371 RepID=A0AAP0E8P8_9MAGN
MAWSLSPSRFFSRSCSPPLDRLLRRALTLAVPLSRSRSCSLTLSRSRSCSPSPQSVRLLRVLSRGRGCMLCALFCSACFELPSPILRGTMLTVEDLQQSSHLGLSRHLTGLILLLEAIRLATIKGLNGSLYFQACLPREEFDEEKEPDGMVLSGWIQARTCNERMVNVLRLRMGKDKTGLKYPLTTINSVNSLAASDLVSKKSLDHGDGNNAVVMIDDEELEGSKKKRLR